MQAHLILFVADQAASTWFYSRLLGVDPTLDVPGMTELPLADGCALGLMPLAGIARLLGEETILPGEPQAPPRSELYLLRADAAECFERGIALGARVVSPMLSRDWGDVAGYLRDPDGHLVALAMPDPAQGA